MPKFSGNSKKTAVELGGIIACCTALMLPAVKFDLFARTYSTFLPLSTFNHGFIDEFIAILLFPTLVLGIYCLRRCKELQREVARRELAEEALRESEERFRLVFEQSTEGIVFAEHPSGRIVYANATMDALLGFTQEDLLANQMPLLFRHFQQENLDQIFADMIQRRDHISTRVHSTGKDGERKILSLRLRAVTICGHDLVYLSFRDMTEKARLEEEARASQGRLIHANKMNSLGLLLSGMAHEINNPNNFVMFNSSMLADIWKDTSIILEDYFRQHGAFNLGGLPFPEIGGATSKLIDGIAEGSHRIKVIVDDLKDFARQDKTGLDRSVDVNQSILKAVSILTPQIRKHTSAFRLELDEGLPFATGNPQQIEQAIINLLLNALQALTRKDAAVVISSSAATDAVHITITDEGTGMSPSTMERLSEPFFTTKSDSAGTGLGLFISTSIIREHQGKLLFQSEPGRGTSAMIELPAAAHAQVVEGRSHAA